MTRVVTHHRDGLHRIVAIGDLNGAHRLLRQILRELEVIDEVGRFIAPGTHLISVGDIFNRGPDARGALALFESLREQAEACGGKVTVLLGNHEVMTALGNELYCTAEEYLSFATPEQRKRWPSRVKQAAKRIIRTHPPDGPMPPLGPRLAAWKIANVPGRAAMRRALGPNGKIGKFLRGLPVVVTEFGCAFCHASLTPRWARLGVEGLNEAAQQEWDAAPPFYRQLPRSSLFVDPKGPLWNREFAIQSSKRVVAQLDGTLRRLGVKRLVVGHTPTGSIPGGTAGHIALRHDGKLVCIDVGLGISRHKTALVIDHTGGTEWTPNGSKVLWQS